MRPLRRSHVVCAGNAGEEPAASTIHHPVGTPVSEVHEMANGNGSPPRIPDWGQWLANEMRQGFAQLDRRIDDVLKEPNRRLDVLDQQIAAVDKAVDTEREERRALQGSIGTWKWIAGIIGIPGILGLLISLANAANLRVTQ